MNQAGWAHLEKPLPSAVLSIGSRSSPSRPGLWIKPHPKQHRWVMASVPPRPSLFGQDCTLTLDDHAAHWVEVCAFPRLCVKLPLHPSLGLVPFPQSCPTAALHLPSFTHSVDGNVACPSPYPPSSQLLCPHRGQVLLSPEPTRPTWPLYRGRTHAPWAQGVPSAESTRLVRCRASTSVWSPPELSECPRLG